MPFTYKVPVPDELAKGAAISLKEWLLNPGDFVDVGYGLALLQTDDGVFELCANGQGLMHHHNVPEGEEIIDLNCVCLLAADGENIPYDRPYSTVRRAE